VNLHNQTEVINAHLVALSRSAAPNCLIAGDLTTLAGFMDSWDEGNFDILVENYRRQIRGLIDGTHPSLTPEHKPIPAEDLIYYGLEYKFVTLYITGELTFEEMRQQLATAIHQFAKRQMTWFRGMERKGIVIHWTRP
jgi:hypothetical protein